ncbi:hydroxyacylglutathione hydrolase [Marinilactibacillus psychrotolerans]|uniref:Hydroxyacylglutathione hydrolase n=1 Tax=Marinilactibacillus psychrotolerans TaxID=191770 RepID=A0A5R9BZY9_9LACT|nr:hydroxyacylglutathione hydrolase [Marinilactibacillus psychrotolerans]TLQ05990.1 hydroxyacylglutathione hydrolase [Marinilactibacillus psychrotolerans]GEQ33767.1 hydroxyacylglutathione hydrolase [Marinilactibacillus psychrotolerans]
MNIHPIEAFSDNYIWVIEEGNEALIVDPGESEGVLRYLEEKQLTLKAILLTHEHNDHIGGVKEVLANYIDTPVYGPKETAQLNDYTVQDGDSFELLGHNFKVFITAGHSNEHISFLMDKNLFCGDALFSGGCGRVFTGDYKAQYDALQKFRALDEDVRVYAGHEYTQTNLRFAQSVEPGNKAVLQGLDEVNKLREKNLPTLPSTIGKEKNINLLLKSETLEEFIDLRKARDNF